MGTRFLTGMAKRYVTEQNDRDTPSPVKRMIWQNRKSLRNHSNRVEPEGFLYLCQAVADVRERALFQTGYLRL